MAQNNLPPKPGALVVLAGKCRAGLVKYETPLNITQITAASLGTDTQALSDAMSAFNTARVNRTNAHKTLSAASNAARDFLGDARRLLAIQWGEAWSTQWAEAGWTDHSTAVPNTQPGRVELTGALAAFLTANPSYEVVQVPPQKQITFTAAQAGIVNGALADALSGVGTADATSGDRLSDRAAADLVVRRDLRALIGILNQKLTPNDTRWAEFGLNAPGKAVTPAAPTGLENHPALPGQVHLTCDVPPGTDHLRWWLEKPGQTEFVNVADTADGELLLTGQTSGETVKLQATAVNTAGESVPSAPISVTVG